MTPTPAPRPAGGRRLPQWIRWLHIYGSMFGLCATLLFAVTGLTLNHADWFEAGEPVVRTLEGTLATKDLSTHVDKLTIAENLREAHHLRGKVAEFAVEDDECIVVWKGPAYSADATIERATGKYRIEESRRPVMALLDDLHKGRDCGPVWAFVIDAAAVVLTLLSVTGLWLLLYLKKRLRSGLVVALVGTIVMVAAFVVGVP
ncbi:MAG: PepSY-associated TM helix domain-containing protein [Planctomycetes bacterium]|nr:PepSY-associated TM helix domain-containing protein [Planctomycetota bacterium]